MELAVLRERSAHSRRIEGKAGPWRKGTLFLVVRCWMTTTRQRFKIPKKVQRRFQQQKINLICNVKCPYSFAAILFLSFTYYFCFGQPIALRKKKTVSDWNGLVQQSFQCCLERPTRIAELQRPRLLREPLVQGTGDCGPQVKNSSFTDLLVVVVVPLITWSSLRICLGVLLASPTTIHTHPVECLFWQYRRKHSTYGMSRVSLRQQTVRR